MKKEEYILQKTEIDTQINLLRDKQVDIFNEYVASNRLFADGERVLLNGAEIAYVSKATIDYSYNIKYGFVREKKDGTPSSIRTRIWFVNTIEKAPKS